MSKDNLTKEELILIDSKLREFTQQFGDGIYVKALIDVILGELYNEPLSIPCEQEQERYQNNYSNEGRMSPNTDK